MANIAELGISRFIAKTAPGFLLKSRLMNTYERDGSHKYNAGDVLIANAIKDGDCFWAGYDGRPVVVVLAYEKGKDEGNKDTYSYRITMHYDHQDTNTRGQKDERDFKWNIENQFRRVPKGFTPEEAVRLYKAKNIYQI